MPRSSKNSPYGPRPTNAEMAAARAAGLPNPRWARQNKMARDRAQKNKDETEAAAQQGANATEARTYGIHDGQDKEQP